MCSYFIVENKIFCSFKKWVFAFLDKGTFQWRGVKFSKIVREIAHKGGSGRIKIFGGGAWVKSGEVNISGWAWYPGGHYGINTDSPSLGNFDTEKFASEWIESADTLKQLNGHN